MSELLHFIQDQEAAFQNKNRLASLYSDFAAQAQLNPTGYTANLSAWKKALFHACRKGKIPAVAAAATSRTTRKASGSENEDDATATDYLSFSTGEELGRALELRPYGRPTGLDEVIKDAVAKKELVPLREYLQQEESIYSKRWIPTPWEVIRWGLRTVGLGILTGQGSLTAGKFVVIENVELAAQEVLELQRALESSPTASIYSLKTFTSTFSQVLGEHCILSAADIQILLRYLSRDKPSLSYDATHQVVKFAPSEITKPQPIEENDISVASVKTLQHSLTLAIPPLESRYTEIDTRLRDALAKKQTSSARSLLKARKLVEKTLEQRRSTLLQVEESLHAIENAATNVEMVNAMQESTKVMRDLNSKVGGVEGVERVTDAMREEMETTEEIGRAVAEPGLEAAAGVDEAEVDEEFEALLASEKAKEDAERSRMEVEAKEKEEEATRAKLRELEEWERRQREQVEVPAVQAQPDSKPGESAPTTDHVQSKEKDEDEVMKRMSAVMQDMHLDDIGTTNTNSERKEEDKARAEDREALLAS